MEKENRYLEYKESINKTYLKTVSAFANYGDGEIIFGVTDDLKVVGIKEPITECLNIENQINDSIKPRPEYELKINDDNTIVLNVKKGFSTPYRFNGKCYRRNDSSTIEVDSLQENRLVLEGMNISYEQLPCRKDNLSFETLSKALTKALDLKSFSNDTLKTLDLYSEANGYNNAAYLFADKNSFAGLDIVVFGDDINVFKKRLSMNGESILIQYEKALEIFKEEYIVEKIEGAYRKKYEMIPFEAFREALANSIIHRSWDVKANTKVELYKEKIVISSPGGLLPEISKEDFMIGSFSCLRNPIIAHIFYRLKLVELFASGIRRIIDVYRSRILKPEFNITENSITITLPVEKEIELNDNEQVVYNKIRLNQRYSRKQLEDTTGFNKGSLIRAINSLLEKELIVKAGKGKNIIYKRK